MREINCLRSNESNCPNTHVQSECSSLSAGIAVNAPLNVEPAHTQFAHIQPSLPDPLLANVVRNTSRHSEASATETAVRESVRPHGLSEQSQTENGDSKPPHALSCGFAIREDGGKTNLVSLSGLSESEPV